MQKNRKKKIGVTAVSVSILTLGAAGLAYAYQSGIDFKPGEDTRDMQENQIVFDSEKNKIDHSTEKEREESELWQKDEQAENRTNSQDKKDSKYLFEQALEMQKYNLQPIIVNEQDGIQNSEDIPSIESGFELISNSDKADTKLNGSNLQESGNNSSTGKPSDGNMSTGNVLTGNTSTGNASDGNTSTGKPSTGEASEEPSNSGSGSESDGNPESPSDKPQQPNTDIEEDYSDTVRDPEIKKEPLPNEMFGEVKYKEGITISDEVDENGDKTDVIIRKPFWMDTLLYKGQQVDEKIIYNSLYTAVYAREAGVKDKYVYVWGEQDLNQYVRIEGISFDAGNTWMTNFPVTIPAEISEGQMKIKVGYRLSKNDSNWVERKVDYDPEEGWIYVLSQKVKKTDKVIDSSSIIRSEKYSEEMVNLFRWQSDLLGNDRLTSLFPGWKENGKIVSWYYKAKQGGRHILQPVDRVALSDDYTVKLKCFWMSEDYQVGEEYNNLCYLQTLVGVDKGAIKSEKTGSHFLFKTRIDTLEIPKYVQAISIEDTGDIVADYLEIPDTVLHIENTNQNLMIKKGYKVAQENPCYTSLENGILTNKEKTKYIRIPYNMKSLKVTDKITSVYISKQNKISKIELASDNIQNFPEINYQNLSNCKIVVKKELLEDYLEQNFTVFTKASGMRVVSEEEPNDVCYVENDAIITEQGKLKKALEKGGSTLQLSTNIKLIGTDALDSNSQIDTILMPKSGKNVIFEKDSLRGSNIKTIQCYSETQFRNAEKQLKRAGAPQGAQVQLVAVSKEGYTYSMVDAQEEESAILISVPENIKEFYGTVTSLEGEEIQITEIKERTFANCKKLEWVILPESILKIGYRAFDGCASLKGILIDTKEIITIGNQAFNGCGNLSFIASNAKKGIMEEDYAPELVDKAGIESCFYVPTNSEGYNNATNFDLESGVDGYQLVDIGGTAKMLYGMDSMGSDWLAIRGAGETPKEVSLAADTVEIFNGAMAGIQSETGAFVVNWEELEGLQWIDDSAFAGSELAGDISLAENSYLGNYAFKGCKNIHSMKIPGESIQIGEGVFNDCNNLTMVELGEANESNYASLYAGIFNGCEKLSKLIFDSELPFPLTTYGGEFRFNYNWSTDEEKEKLHIQIPEGTETQYIKEWRYSFSGYFTYYQMWNEVFWNLMGESGEIPSNKEVDINVEETLLNSENRIRTMLNSRLVEEPTDLYPYYWYDALVLVGAPSYIEELDLGTADMELPYGMAPEYIASNTFSKCKNLKHVIIPSTLYGIYTDAFEGVLSDQLILTFEGTQETEVPQFLMNDSQEPFTFGVDDSHLKIEVPEGTEYAYIRALEFPMLGYSDFNEWKEAIRDELKKSLDDEIPDDVLSVELEKRMPELIEIENHIRVMMGMNLIDKVEDLACEWRPAVDKEENKEEDSQVMDESGEQESNPEQEVIQQDENIQEDVSKAEEITE